MKYSQKMILIPYSKYERLLIKENSQEESDQPSDTPQPPNNVEALAPQINEKDKIIVPPIVAEEKKKEIKLKKIKTVLKRKIKKQIKPPPGIPDKKTTQNITNKWQRIWKSI